MPDRESPETPGEPADTSDDDHEEQTKVEPVPHSSSSHREWRPEYEVWRREDELLQRDLGQLLRKKNSDRND